MTAHFAAELGGAIYNAGAWEVTDTVFSENTAEGGGLAIHEAGSSLELWNTTFYGNVFSCPTDQYSDARHVRILVMMMRFSLCTPILGVGCTGERVI